MTLDFLNDPDYIDFANACISRNFRDIAKFEKNFSEWEPDQWLHWIIQLLHIVVTDLNIAKSIRIDAAKYLYHFCLKPELYEGKYTEAIKLGNVAQLCKLAIPIMDDELPYNFKEFRSFEYSNYKDIVDLL